MPSLDKILLFGEKRIIALINLKKELNYFKTGEETPDL